MVGRSGRPVMDFDIDVGEEVKGRAECGLVRAVARWNRRKSKPFLRREGLEKSLVYRETQAKRGVLARGRHK